MPFEGSRPDRPLVSTPTPEKEKEEKKKEEKEEKKEDGE